jgi:hypothetical protein
MVELSRHQAAVPVRRLCNPPVTGFRFLFEGKDGVFVRIIGRVHNPSFNDN